MRQVIGDLMDESPTVLGERELEGLPEKVKAAAEALPWVAQAAVRLREQGHAVTGAVFVVPRDSIAGLDLVGEIERATSLLCNLDWRLHDLAVMPVSAIERDTPPRTRDAGATPRAEPALAT
jgi:hypothetical protein